MVSSQLVAALRQKIASITSRQEGGIMKDSRRQEVKSRARRRRQNRRRAAVKRVLGPPTRRHPWSLRHIIRGLAYSFADRCVATTLLLVCWIMGLYIVIGLAWWMIN